MRREHEVLVWIVTGGLGAMALGVVLIPLRALTSASNLAFVFLVFTIVVAELGGRAAGLVTAVVSAISLNFFLTEPYLTLTITKPDDVVAFFALAACGLIAAAFGTRRERWLDRAGRAGKDLDILKTIVGKLTEGVPLEEILGDLKRSFGLSAVVLRDAGERILAAVPLGSTPPVPDAGLTLESLIPSEETRVRFGLRGVRLPAGGGRLRVPTDRGPISVDLWEGDARGFDVDESRTLTIAASAIGLAVSRRHAG